MKPNAILAAAVAASSLLPGPATAQTPWRAGFRIGANLSRLAWGEADREESFEGALSGGVLVERRLGGLMSLQSGVLVLQRSNATEAVLCCFETVPGGGASLPVRVELHQRLLEIPLLLKATFGRGRLRPWVAAGPTVEIHASASREVIALEPLQGASAAFRKSESLDGLFRDVVLGFEVATGVDCEIAGAMSLHADLRWAPGLSNLTDLPAGQPALRSDDVRILTGVGFEF